MEDNDDGEEGRTGHKWWKRSKGYILRRIKLIKFMEP